MGNCPGWTIVMGWVRGICPSPLPPEEPRLRSGLGVLAGRERRHLWGLPEGRRPGKLPSRAGGDQGSSPSKASTQRSWVMFFSRLGPATAVHSAYRKNTARLGISTQRLLSPLPISPGPPSYLEKLAMIWILRVGFPEET